MFRSLPFLLLPIVVISQEADENWQLAKKKNDIEVYIKDTPGSKIKEFKATVVIKASIDKLAYKLDHPEDFPKWMANCAAVQVLDEKPNSQTVYFLTKLPWPIADRDAVFRIKRSSEEKKVVYTHFCEPEQLPQKEGTVRITIAKGSWTLIELKTGETKVIYQYYADPGGTIPAWVINMFIVSGPYETLLNLKKLSID